MITEAVVEDPDSFPDCGQYLGDLFGGSQRHYRIAHLIDPHQRERNTLQLGC